jgi:hypothetical protein
MLLVEADAALFELCAEHCPKLDSQFMLPPEMLRQRITLFETRGTDFFGKTFPPPGTFRRILRIDFSAGTALYPALYDDIERALENAAAQFWKNRATLMQLGRLYCRNLFLNLSRLPYTEALPQKRIARPILVVASGPGTDKLLALETRLLRAFYIIAVDTALPVLLEKGITPDLVVQVEAQFAIEAAYIRAGDAQLNVVADLVSRRHNARWYFFSAFTDAAFIRRLRSAGLLPAEIPAMGSVALSAVYIALRFRARDDIPVYVAGADFSFMPGKTHCKGTPAHTAQLLGTTRLKPAGDFSAAYRDGAFVTRDKNNKPVVTDPALMSYGASFTAIFCGESALFDAGETGIPLGIPRVTTAHLEASARALKTADGEDMADSTDAPAPSAQRILDFLTEEEHALIRLRELLAGKDALSPAEREKAILALLEEREYLYLHFPDGYRVSTDTAFLKRVRAEIDFFLKDIRRGQGSAYGEPLEHILQRRF